MWDEDPPFSGPAWAAPDWRARAVSRVQRYRHGVPDAPEPTAPIARMMRGLPPLDTEESP